MIRCCTTTFLGLLVGLLLRIISRSSNHGNYYLSSDELPLFHRTSRTLMYCCLSFNFQMTLVHCAIMTLYISISLNHLNTSLFLCLHKYLCNMIIRPYLQKSLHSISPPRFPSTNFAANEWHGCLCQVSTSFFNPQCTTFWLLPGIGQ